MSHPAFRVAGIALLAVAGLTCTDESITGARSVRRAAFSIAPAFSEAPAGGPTIDIQRVRAVLRGTTDSVVVDAGVEGDSAVLVFERVQVRGDSAKFVLGVSAFDANDVLIFKSEDEVNVKPGDNPPAQPELVYTAPDAVVDSIEVPGTSVSLDWDGARGSASTCKSRSLDEGATTQTQLSINAFSAGSPVAAGARVGWTSRDTSVVTVTPQGLVRARCANKSTWVVARTFLDEADSIQVNVSAPPFSLVMTPDSVSLARGDSVDLHAVAIDELGNEVEAVGTVAWTTSDPSRATVDPNGKVKALKNGRVQIIAGFEGRITVGIVQVVRPPAAGVVVTPGLDTAAIGQSRAFFAKAVDATGRIIGDASGFAWSSTAPTVASVNSITGAVQANGVGDALIIATLDGRADTAKLRVEETLPPGAVRSRIVHAASGDPIEGALISGPVTSTTSAADGSFTLGGLQEGDDVTVEKDGYVTITLFDAPIYRNTTLQLPDAPMIPATAVPGSMSGTVKNAVTGNVVSGIAVDVYSGINAGPSPSRPFATPVTTTSTNPGGTFSVSGLQAGVYTLIFNGTGYSQAISVGVVMGDGTNFDNEAVLLAPATNAAGLAIVLTWGPCGEVNVPCDLDLHLVGPTIPDTGRFHVNFDERAYIVGGDTVAALDLQDATGPGPEVIGLRGAAAPGSYQLFVRNKSDAGNGASMALADSSFARIDIYQDNRVIATFFPPTGQAGTVWKVFEFDGARITPLSTVCHIEDISTLPSATCEVPDAGGAAPVTPGGGQPLLRQYRGR